MWPVVLSMTLTPAQCQSEKGREKGNRGSEGGGDTHLWLQRQGQGTWAVEPGRLGSNSGFSPTSCVTTGRLFFCSRLSSLSLK